MPNFKELNKMKISEVKNRFDAMELILEEKFGLTVDGKAVWVEIEEKVANNGYDGETWIESVFYQDGRKVMLEILVNITHGGDEEDGFFTDIKYIDIRKVYEKEAK